jgi:hypothetical protein
MINCYKLTQSEGNMIWISIMTSNISNFNIYTVELEFVDICATISNLQLMVRKNIDSTQQILSSYKFMGTLWESKRYYSFLIIKDNTFLDLLNN